MFLFEGLMAEVLVTNRVEWCAGRWLLQKRGEIWKADVCRQKCRHSELVSDVYLGYLQFSMHLSDCTRFPSESLCIAGIKIAFIYSILTCQRTACMKEAGVDSIKATPIRFN